MAKRGESKIQKALSAPTVRHFNRKDMAFTPKPRPGTHNKQTCVPLSFCLKHLSEVARNNKEVKTLLSAEKIKVNGVVRKEMNFNVGIFDVVEIAEIKKKFRAILDDKGRLKLREIAHKDGNSKISRVEKKTVIAGGKVMITTNEGFTIDAGKHGMNVDDSVKISLPGLKVEEVFKMVPGSTVFIVNGSHVGHIAKVEAIAPGTLKREKLVSLEEDGKKFQTVIGNVFVIGKDRAEIEAVKE